MGALVSPVVTLVRPAIISPLGNSAYSNNNYVGSVIDTSLFTFTRDSTAYLGSLLYASGVARTGTDSTWGQYIEVEEGTTNFYNGITPWAMVKTGTTPTITSYTGSDIPGPGLFWSIAYTGDGSAWAGIESGNCQTGMGSLAVGDTVTASGWYNIPSTGTVTSCGFQVENTSWTASNSSHATTTFTKDGAWHKYSLTATVTTACTSYIISDLFAYGYTTDAITIYCGGFQIEKKGYKTSFLPKLTTRAAEVIYAPNSYITASTGTIAARFSVDVLTSSIQMIADAAGLSSTGLALYVNASGYLEASYGSGSAQVTVTSTLAVTADTVYDAILTWSSSGVNLYCAASATGTVYTATSSTAPSISLNTNMYFGSNQGTQYFLNGKLYNVVGIGRALSSTEAAALIGTSWGVNLI